MPTKAHNTDACFDLYAPTGARKGDFFWVPSHGSVMVDLGFATEIPEGYFAAVFPRSGTASKKHLRNSNCVGVIDAGYRGTWKVSLHNDSDQDQMVSYGDRIAQFCILPVLETNLSLVDSLENTDRGERGFGSSGQ
nr:MAG TPA: dUTPase [Caudoviricetes sp.]